MPSKKKYKFDAISDSDDDQSNIINDIRKLNQPAVASQNDWMLT